MNILFICEFYPHSLMPIGGSFFHNFAKGLVQIGNKVEVCHFREIGNYDIKKFKALWIKKTEVIDNVPIYILFLPKIPKMNFINDFRVYISLERFVINKHKKTPYDIIHIHFSQTKASSMGIKIAKKLGIPIVLTEHSTGFLIPQELDATLKEAKPVLASVDAVSVVSEKLREVLQPYTRKKVRIVNNGIDPDLFVPKIKNSTVRKLVSIAFLHKKKNFDTLLYAYKKFNSERPGFSLDIIGDGPEMSFLINLITELGLQENVRLLGLRTNEEISKLLPSYDYFVLPSKTETFGVVVLEALFSGLPVLVTRCGGPERFVRDGLDGIVVEPDVDGLSQGLNELVGRKWEIDREYLLNTFSITAVAKELEAIYRSVVK